jgi:hypothetical protein
VRRSARPRKTVNLSKSIHQQLNAYALAASATGVSALALTLPAEAKIIYTPTHKVVQFGKFLYLDLNNDKTNDFAFTGTQPADTAAAIKVCGPLRNGKFSSECRSSKNTGPNRIWGYTHYASALPAGVRISSNKRFGGAPHNVMEFEYCKTGNPSCQSKGYRGQWHDRESRYLGLKFSIRGSVHYGWARLNTSTGLFVLTGYAYETIPNKPIIAGKTKGPDEVEKHDPGASLASPIPAPQPASLGALATGARGLSIWRRKETAVESK